MGEADPGSCLLRVRQPREATLSQQRPYCLGPGYILLLDAASADHTMRVVDSVGLKSPPLSLPAACEDLRGGAYWREIGRRDGGNRADLINIMLGK